MVASLFLATVLLVSQADQAQPAGGRPPSSEEPQSMVDVAVTLKPGTEIATVEAALVQAGLMIERRLDAIGSITGKAAPQAIPKLRTVAGVEDVSEIEPIQIAPPDSPIQ